MRVARKKKRKNILEELTGERNGAGYGTLAERLKNKAGSDKTVEESASWRFTVEGLQIMTFWILFLAFTATGCGLLFSLAILSFVPWFNY